MAVVGRQKGSVLGRVGGKLLKFSMAPACTTDVQGGFVTIAETLKSITPQSMAMRMSE